MGKTIIKNITNAGVVSTGNDANITYYSYSTQERDMEKIYEEELLATLSEHTNAISSGLKELSVKLDAVEAISEHHEQAVFYHYAILDIMNDIRTAADAAESLIPDSLLPYPTYDKLLFSVV